MRKHGRDSGWKRPERHTKGAVTCCTEFAPKREALLAFFSCSDGTFHEGNSNLAENLLLKTHGPLATFAATTLSHPYGNIILPRELGYALLDMRLPTYGEVITAAKYNSVHRIDQLREDIDDLAQLVVSGSLNAIILSHLTMYNLLGDPAVPTFAPQGSIAFGSLDHLTAGQTFIIQGSALKEPEHIPMTNGTVTVTLEIPRSKFLEEITPCGQDVPTCLQNHELANNKTVASATGTVSGGIFSVDLTIPDLLPDTDVFYIRAYAQGEDLEAIGSKQVTLQP